MMKKICYLMVFTFVMLSINVNSTIINAKTKNTERARAVKTINPIKIYNGKVFKHAKVIKSVKVGEKLLVKKLVSAGGMTRFELTNGHYITANKRYVKLLNK